MLRPTLVAALIATVAVLVSLILAGGGGLRPPPASTTHLCGDTGSPVGPFGIVTYEARNWQNVYARAMEFAGFNQLLPEVSTFQLPPLESGPRAAGSAGGTSAYIPPTLLKAVAWIESSWVGADWSVPYGQVGPALISHDCGYGIMQVTTGMQNTTGVPSLDQLMIGGHYGFNIARGARILAEKWNFAPEYRPQVGDRDPHIVENWYYAVWSYNGFAFSNHPLNPRFDPLRAPYRCDGNQSRSSYPYQELVFGCIANPPVSNGVRLWDPVPVTLPSRSDPAFSLDAWNACAGGLQCAAMDITTPGADGIWWISGIGGVQWGDGLSGDIPVPADYNGDGITDLAFWRPSTGTWWIRGIAGIQWGDGPSGDIPVPADYNGDGITDLAVWRPSTGTWWIRGIAGIQWGDGPSGDIPVPADYTGDGIAELAVWRPSTGTWWIRGIAGIQWGDGPSGDIPLPADYNGDGIAELAVWHPSTGTWWIRGIAGIQWGDGSSRDIPVPADYNGDGITELAVWRPSTGTWWIRGIAGIQWGDGPSGDIPVPADYSGDGRADVAVWRTSSSSQLDPTTTNGDRNQAIGAPVPSVSPVGVNLVTASGTQSGLVSVTISNVGTGPFVWRLSPSVSWLKLSLIQGISLGTDIGPVASTFTFYVDALNLPTGTHYGQIIIDSLYPSGTPLSVSVAVQVPGDVPAPADYNADGNAEPAVWRSSQGTWHVFGGVNDLPWGEPGDIPVPADYNGDLVTDIAVWRPSTGVWHIKDIAATQWGAAGDIPAPGDYDGDGRTDPAVWRPSRGTWHVYGVVNDVPWGAPGDVPVPGDYNGDGKTDLAVWRPSNGVWYINGIAQSQWGDFSSGDIPVPGDYDGDGVTDLAVWRPATGVWHIRGVADIQWGDGPSRDIPVPADYDGDGVTDLAVWRPSTGVWHIRGIADIQWGVGL